MKKNILYFLFACSATSVSVNAAALRAAIERYKPAGVYSRYKTAREEAGHAITGPRRNFGPPPPHILFEQAPSSPDYGPIAPPLSPSGGATTTTREQQEIYSAATNGDLRLIQQCIAAMMNIDEPDYGYGHDCYTPLLKAAQAGHNDIVVALLKAGARIDFVSVNNILREDGNTALILASYEGHLNVVQTLLKNHANVSWETTSGYTALMFATYQGMACCDEKKKHDFDRIVEELYYAGASMPLPGVFHGAAATAGGMGDDVPPLEHVDDSDDNLGTDLD